jgi:hypothetical protein
MKELHVFFVLSDFFYRHISMLQAIVQEFEKKVKGRGGASGKMETNQRPFFTIFQRQLDWMTAEWMRETGQSPGSITLREFLGWLAEKVKQEDARRENP